MGHVSFREGNSVLDCEEQDSNNLQLNLQLEEVVKPPVWSAAGMTFLPWILIRSRG